jgi:hypothetical protein
VLKEEANIVFDPSHVVLASHEHLQGAVPRAAACAQKLAERRAGEAIGAGAELLVEPAHSETSGPNESKMQ